MEKLDFRSQGRNAVNWKTALSLTQEESGGRTSERASASTALHAQRPTLNISSTIAVSCYKNLTVRMINMQRYIMLRANTLARARARLSLLVVPFYYHGVHKGGRKNWAALQRTRNVQVIIFKCKSVPHLSHTDWHELARQRHAGFGVFWNFASHAVAFSGILNGVES